MVRTRSNEEEAVVEAGREVAHAFASDADLLGLLAQAVCALPRECCCDRIAGPLYTCPRCLRPSGTFRLVCRGWLHTWERCFDAKAACHERYLDLAYRPQPAQGGLATEMSPASWLEVFHLRARAAAVLTNPARPVEEVSSASDFRLSDFRLRVSVHDENGCEWLECPTRAPLPSRPHRPEAAAC